MYLYNQGSQGGKALARGLGVKCLRHGERSTFKGGPNSTVINWGSGDLPQFNPGTRIINRPQLVSEMTNKKTAFIKFHANGVRVPQFTTEKQTAQHWVDDGKMVFARTVLNGHSGAGIVIMDPDNGDNYNTQAPLYTLYVPKEDEFRVHIVNKQVILIQRKGLKEEFRGQPDVNWKVRNLANGFIFARNDIVVPEDVTAQSLAAISASGLDFGAVDVVFNRARREAYVLEINTAPGLVGSTVDDYANALRNI
jgi:glutathione synthase/RimK-type ligase-like ATP-grasp enzyme